MRFLLALLALPALAMASSWAPHFDQTDSIDYATSATCTGLNCFVTGGPKSTTSTPPVLYQSAIGDLDSWVPTAISSRSCAATMDLVVSHATAHPSAGVVLAAGVDRDPSVAPDTTVLVYTDITAGEYTVLCMPRMPGTVVSIKPLDMSAKYPVDASFAVLTSTPITRGSSSSGADSEYTIHTVRDGRVRSSVAVSADLRHPVSHFSPLNDTSFLIATTTFPWSSDKHALDTLAHCRRLSPHRCVSAAGATPDRVAAANKRAGNANGERKTDIWVSSPMALEWARASVMEASLHDLACGDAGVLEPFCAAAVTDGDVKSVVVSKDGGKTWSRSMSKESACGEYTAVAVSQTSSRVAAAYMDDDCTVGVVETNDLGEEWKNTFSSDLRYVVQGIQVKDNGAGIFYAISADWESHNLLIGASPAQ